MEWIGIGYKLPKSSGECVISVEVKSESGVAAVSSYVAYFDKKTEEWYKTDRFDSKLPKTIINAKILGWIKDMPSFLGNFR